MPPHMTRRQGRHCVGSAELGARRAQRATPRSCLLQRRQVEENKDCREDVDGALQLTIEAYARSTLLARSLVTSKQRAKDVAFKL